MHRSIAALLPLLLSAGCGSNPDAACDINLAAGTMNVHACIEFDNLSTADIQAANDACGKQNGKVVDACSTDDALGFCTLSQGGITANEYFYPGGGVTVAIAKQACEQSAKGTWTTK